MYALTQDQYIYFLLAALQLGSVQTANGPFHIFCITSKIFLSPYALNFFSLQLTSSYDPKFGGFGSAPKFPRPVEVCVMLYKQKQLMDNGKDSETRDIMRMVTQTLQCMARGGIHDHVGGGFHRYSVDECWHG